jgi:hypothetical protein
MMSYPPSYGGDRYSAAAELAHEREQERQDAAEQDSAAEE